MTSTPLKRSLAWALFIGVSAIFVWLAIRDAWLCDDAFITLRVVDNFHDGFGLRWNVIDRVQVFTHPLWCFALLGLGGVFRNLPLAALWLSIIVSLAAFLLIVPRPGWPNADLIFLALLIPASKAATQFATSGLEGPLASILLAVLVLTCGGLKTALGALRPLGAAPRRRFRFNPSGPAAHCGSALRSLGRTQGHPTGDSTPDLRRRSRRGMGDLFICILRKPGTQDRSRKARCRCTVFREDRPRASLRRRLHAA